MLLSSVSNLSRSAKMHSGFFISSGFQVDSILDSWNINADRRCAKNFKRFKRFILHLFVSRYSILIWYLKREYPNTQLSNIKAVSVYNVLKWGSGNWCENLGVSSIQSSVATLRAACPTSYTEQNSEPWLMVLWLTDSSPHCKVSSWGAELSVRGAPLLCSLLGPETELAAAHSREAALARSQHQG